MERVNPSGITYSQGAIPLGTPAKSSVRKFYPKNGRDFTPTGTNIIQLPLYAEGQFMDCAGHSFLKFDFLNKSSHTCVFGGGGPQGLFKRVRVLSATGQQLEDMDDYNALHSLLQDVTCGVDYVNSTLQTKSGASVYPSTQAAVGPNKKKTVTMNLVSGLLMQPKYLPLLMTKGGLLIEITLEAADKALIGDSSTTSSDYQVSNMEYVAELVDFGPEFNSNFIQMMAGSGGALLSGVTYRNHTNTIKGGDKHVDITERSRSIKSIVTIFRQQGGKYESKPKLESIGDRQIPKELRGYQYRVGSITYPEHFVKLSTACDGLATSQPEFNVSEACAHLLKSLGSALTDVRHQTCLTEANFAGDETATGVLRDGNQLIGYGAESGKQRGMGGLAVSLESFAKDSSKLESGLNSAAQALPLRLDLDTTGPFRNSVNNADQTFRVNTYVMCDALFNFLPNGDVVASI